MLQHSFSVPRDQGKTLNWMESSPDLWIGLRLRKMCSCDLWSIKMDPGCAYWKYDLSQCDSWAWQSPGRALYVSMGSVEFWVWLHWCLEGGKGTRLRAEGKCQPSEGLESWTFVCFILLSSLRRGTKNNIYNSVSTAGCNIHCFTEVDGAADSSIG